MKVIIVGGVAGGASCAARLRRLNEDAEIILVERGPYVSYANCGLPYYVGGVIDRESSLLVADERTFRGLFQIDARTRCEAIEILPEEKCIKLRNVATGEVTVESYDKLVLSPGALPISPDLRNRSAGHLPGADGPGRQSDSGMDRRSHGSALRTGRLHRISNDHALDPALAWVPTGEELETLRAALDF